MAQGKLPYNFLPGAGVGGLADEAQRGNLNELQRQINALDKQIAAGGGGASVSTLPATATTTGTVRTDVTETNPVAVLKSTFDANKSITGATTAEVTAGRQRPAVGVFAANLYTSLAAQVVGIWTALATAYAWTLTTGTGLAGGGNVRNNLTVSLSATGVASGTYGSSSRSVVLTTNAQGQITAASDVAIAGSGGGLGSSGYLNTNSAADQALTDTYATVSDMTAVLTAAGSYFIEAVLAVLCGATAGDEIDAQLYDASNSAAIVKSESRVTVAAASQRTQIITRAMVTTTGAATIVPQVKNATAARGSLVKSNSHMSWLQITRVDPVTVVFDPSTLPGINLWLKADALTLANGAAVASWASSLSGGPTYNQATSGSQPVYESAGIGGMPAVKSTGTQYLTAASGYPNLTGDFCLYAVVRFDTGGRNNPFFGGATSYAYVGNTSGNNFVLVNNPAGGGYVLFGDASIQTGSAILRIKRVGTSCSFRATGIAETSQFLPASTLSLEQVLARTFQGDVMIGALSEAIVTTTAPTDGGADDMNVRNYLTTKYGLGF